jgi:ABC-type dipeptide/oligopeptide/nickel transport system permease subunit
MTASTPIHAVVPRKCAPTTVSRFFKNPLARIGLTLLFLLIIVAFLAPTLGKSADPSQIYPGGTDALGVPHSPDREFRFGADTLGRDVWTRALFGARISLVVALCAMLTSTFIGTTIGLVGGFFDAIYRNCGVVTDDFAGNYSRQGFARTFARFLAFQSHEHQS